MFAGEGVVPSAESQHWLAGSPCLTSCLRARLGMGFRTRGEVWVQRSTGIRVAGGLREALQALALGRLLAGVVSRSYFKL